MWCTWSIGRGLAPKRVHVQPYSRSRGSAEGASDVHVVVKEGDVEGDHGRG